MRELPPGDTRRKTTAVATALDLQQARRCHFAAPLIATLKGTWAIIVFLIVTFFREISALKSAGTLLLFAALGLVVLLLLILVFNVLRWRRIFILAVEILSLSGVWQSRKAERHCARKAWPASISSRGSWSACSVSLAYSLILTLPQQRTICGFVIQ